MTHYVYTVNIKYFSTTESFPVVAKTIQEALARAISLHNKKHGYKKHNPDVTYVAKGEGVYV